MIKTVEKVYFKQVYSLKIFWGDSTLQTPIRGGIQPQTPKFFWGAMPPQTPCQGGFAPLTPPWNFDLVRPCSWGALENKKHIFASKIFFLET